MPLICRDCRVDALDVELLEEPATVRQELGRLLYEPLSQLVLRLHPEPAVVALCDHGPWRRRQLRDAILRPRLRQRRVLVEVIPSAQHLEAVELDCESQMLTSFAKFSVSDVLWPFLV